MAPTSTRRSTRPSRVIKFVHDELVETLGGETMQVTFASKPPTVVLMAGLQGAGKTTNAAKLARWFKAQGRNPMLIGADLQRPAAVEQLRTLGRQIDVPVFSEPSDPVEVARRRMEEAADSVATSSSATPPGAGHRRRADGSRCATSATPSSRTTRSWSSTR